MAVAEFIKIYPDGVEEAKIDKIVDIMRNGGLVIYPTDTVYGLGCDMLNKKAMEKLARLKGIRLDKADFSFICNDLSNLSDYVAQIETKTFKVLKRNLPGPYTFVLPGSSQLPKYFNKKKEVGIRIPDNPIILKLAEKLGNPIASTSIRDEDAILEYTTDPELIHEKWGKLVDVVIDGGYGGNEASTVIDLTGDDPELIREGKGSISI